MESFRPTARICFAIAFLAAQAWLIGTGARRPDRLFAFQMFNESSTIEIHLARRVRAGASHKEVPLQAGTWSVPDAQGGTRKLRFRDRVRDRTLSALDRPVHAAYGVDAQLFRLARALDDAAAHDPDPGLIAFVADVDVSRNGRPKERVHLESQPR
jgi:hypothetical protein